MRRAPPNRAHAAPGATSWYAGKRRLEGQRLWGLPSPDDWQLAHAWRGRHRGFIPFLVRAGLVRHSTGRLRTMRAVSPLPRRAAPVLGTPRRHA